MTKEKLYQDVSKLFPSELGVGDIVEVNSQGWKIISIVNYGTVVNIQSLDDEEILPCPLPHLKLIRKNITLSMVLEAMWKNYNKSMINYNIDNYYAIKDFDEWVEHSDYHIIKL